MVMLSPAEELGLSGLSLDSRVRKALYGIPPGTMVDLEARMTAESARRSMIYLRNGQPETIRVMLRPLGVMPDQLAYLHVVTLSILGALKRMPDMYLEDAEVRKVV